MHKIFKIDFGDNRVYGLDIIRCVAILQVVYSHGTSFFSYKTEVKLDYLVFDGMSMFFVLSGYLIGTILIKEIETKGHSNKILYNFWKRRWYRTLPNYFLILSIVTFITYFSTDYFNLKRSIKFYIFSQSLFYPHPKWFPEAWSLSVEEWFYLIIPFILFLMIRCFKISAKKSILIIAILVILSITTFRYIKFLSTYVSNHAEWDALFRTQVITRIDSIMYGLLGAYTAYYHKNIWYRVRKIMLIIGVLLLLMNKYFIRCDFGSVYNCVFLFSVNAIGTLFIMPFLCEIKNGKGIIYKIVTYVSLISYSMYLINLSIVKYWIIGNIEIDFLNSYLMIITKYLLYWSFTIVLSILLYKYFELPTTKLRDK
jgi:peptidoglycan/LPS O-acetylase OafA/YrhL